LKGSGGGYGTNSGTVTLRHKKRMKKQERNEMTRKRSTGGKGYKGSKMGNKITDQPSVSDAKRKKEKGGKKGG